MFTIKKLCLFLSLYIISFGQIITGLKSYNESNGLISNEIICIKKSSISQKLYIGTTTGLSIFNSYEFQNINLNKDATDTRSRFVTSLLEDPKRKLFYIGTNGGITVLKNDRVEKILTPPKHPFVHTLYMDGKERLWYSTYREYGYIENDKFFSFEKPKGENIFSFIEIDAKIYAIASSKLYEFKDNGLLVKDELNSGWNSKFKKLHDNSIWLYGKKSIFYFDTSSNRFVSFFKFPNSSQSIVMDILLLSKHRLWISLYNQYPLLINTKSKKHSELKFSKKINVARFLQDGKDIWLGTRDNGLILLDSLESQFKWYPLADSNNKVNTFHQYKNSVYIGTDQKNYRFSLKESTLIKTDNNISSISDISHHSNQLWYGSTKFKGIRVHDSNENTVLKLNHEHQSKKNLSRITSVVPSEENMWIGTYSSGLIRYNFKNKTFHFYQPIKNDSTSINRLYIKAIAINKKKVFVSFKYGGWGYFNKDDLTVFHRKKSPFKSVVHAFQVKSPKEVYMAVGTKGLLLLNLVNNSYKQYLNEGHGQQSHIITNVLLDKAKQVWVLTGSGVALFKEREKQFINFPFAKEHKMLSPTLTQEFYRDERGFFYIAHRGGFTRFHPKNLASDAEFRSVQVQKIDIFSKERRTVHFSEAPKKISLKAFENTFSIDFFSINYGSEDDIKYRYRIKNSHQKPIFLGKKRNLVFSNFEAGKYILELNAINRFGKWNPKPSVLEIEIAMYYWQTWPFRLALISACFLIIYALYRYQVRKKVELEKVRLNIASDLHDNLGADLTKIALYSDLLSGSQSATYLKRLKQLSLSLRSSLDDLVWSIDSRNDTLSNLISRMETTFRSNLENSDIAVTIKRSEAKKDLTISSITRNQILLIVKEASHNIMKHSMASQASLEINLIKKELFIRIQDNGTGFDRSLKVSGNGLKNIKMRTQRLKAKKITLNSDKGTKLEFYVDI